MEEGTGGTVKSRRKSRWRRKLRAFSVGSLSLSLRNMCVCVHLGGVDFLRILI